MSSERQETLVFREASSLAELATLLKLRDPAFRLDLYDLKSWHLGLFIETELRSEPIGYLRVVENRGITDWRMRELASQHPDAFAETIDDPAPLPLLNDWPDPAALRRYDRQAGLDVRIVETTHRTLASGFDDLGLDVFLIESAVAAFFFTLCVEVALMKISVMQQERFEKLGFAVAEGTREVRIGSHGDWFVCLVATPDSVKPLLHSSILEQAHQYGSKERITMDLAEWMAAVA